MTTQIRIKPGGEWHRRARGNGDDHTACGLPVGGAFAVRDTKLDDDLCDVCFTRHERDTGQMKKVELDAERERANFHDPDDEPTDPNGDPTP